MKKVKEVKAYRGTVGAYEFLYYARTKKAAYTIHRTKGGTTSDSLVIIPGAYPLPCGSVVRMDRRVLSI